MRAGQAVHRTEAASGRIAGKTAHCAWPRLLYFFAIEMARRRFASLPGFSNDWPRPAFLAKIFKKKAGETTILRFHRRHLLELA